MSVTPRELVIINPSEDIAGPNDAPSGLPGGLQSYADAHALLTKDRRSAATARAYNGDVDKFFRWWKGAGYSPALLRMLCELETARLAFVLNDYAASMRREGLSEATSNRRLSALRSMLKICRRLGLGNADPAGLVDSEKVTTYRDTRGPSKDEVRRILAGPDRSTPAGKRDFALLVLMWENALRRSEVCDMCVKHFDAGEKRLQILGKGKGTQRQPVTVSDRLIVAIGEYLGSRPGAHADEPLFLNHDHKQAHLPPAERGLRANGLYTILGKYGAQTIGRHLHPHAMRHAAITAVLDATGGDVRTAQRLSRHADLRTLQRYDDNREDLQGKATALLSALV